MKKKIGSLLLTLAFCLSSTACSVDEVLTNLDVATQAIQSVGGVIAAINPGDGLAVEAGAAVIGGGLQTIKADYDVFQASKSSGDLQALDAVIASTQANIAQVEATVHLKDAQSQAAFAATLAIVKLALDTIVTEMTAAKTANTFAGAMAFTNATVATHASDLKSKWDNEVCNKEKACRAKVKVHKVKSKKVADGSDPLPLCRPSPGHPCPQQIS